MVNSYVKGISVEVHSLAIHRVRCKLVSSPAMTSAVVKDYGRACKEGVVWIVDTVVRLCLRGSLPERSAKRLRGFHAVSSHTPAAGKSQQTHTTPQKIPDKRQCW